MLDQSPWTRDENTMRSEADKYHKRLKELSVEDLAAFVKVAMNHQGNIEELVKLIEDFMHCLMPFDRKELEEKLILAGDNYSVYLHMAMCCLGTVAGKTDDGTRIGKDCSFFGRFHGRLEESFMTG